MPYTVLSAADRRAVAKAILSGEDALSIAGRYGIGRQRVYDIRDEVKSQDPEEQRQNAREELAFWEWVGSLKSF